MEMQMQMYAKKCCLINRLTTPKMSTNTQQMKEKPRCAKCNAPFLHHEKIWTLADKEGFYHTSCKNKIMTNQHEDLREKFDKYLAWVLSSGLHGIHLAKPIADFWLQKLAEREKAIVERIEGMKYDKEKGDLNNYGEMKNLIIDDILKALT